MFNDSLETDGIAAKDDKSVMHPIAEYQPEADFSDEARRQKRRDRPLDFEVDIGLVIDANGKPQNVCMTQSAGYGLDANAAKAVQKYQFKPATKDGKPVAYRISVEIRFHLY
jgi:TonB family protein